MTQEEKQLLLKDLCSRLPYGVKVSLNTDGNQNIGTLDALYPNDECSIIVDNLEKPISLCPGYGTINYGRFSLEESNFKPYLRPMSSMTEDEQRTLDSMCNGVEMVSRLSGLKMFDKAFDWLNANHFDYRGLIEKGLALEAPEGMYKSK